MDIKPDEIKDQSSLNNDQKEAELQAEEDRKNAEDLVKQEEERQRKEDQTKSSEAIYQEKLAELEKEQEENRHKGAALKEKNEKIQELKKKLEEGTVLDEDAINEKINNLIDEKIALIQNDSTKGAQALKIAEDNAVDSKISKIAKNEGEEKIIRFYFDNKVNKELPLNERINQALAQASFTLNNDKKFQEEITKANESAIKTTGKGKEHTSVWSENAKSFANSILQTDKGKKAFEELGRNR